MRNQTSKLPPRIVPERASIPNKLSRILLAAEALVIILPIVVLASILGFFFLIIWLPLAVGSSIFDPGIQKSFLVAVIGLSAVGSLAYLAVVTQLSVGYVFAGRPSLERVSRLQWSILFIGPAITISWVVIACLNYGSGSDTTLSANSIFFVPGLLLVLPTFHLYLAERIAEYRLQQSLGIIRAGT